LPISVAVRPVFHNSTISLFLSLKFSIFKSLWCFDCELFNYLCGSSIQ
jgi:hypothetical protein